MEFYTMQWPRKSSTKMELKWSLVSMAIARNTESTSNTIDCTGKSTWSAFSIKFATNYLCAWRESRRGRTSTSTLIQTPTSYFYIYIFVLDQTVMYWAVLSWKFIPVIFLDWLAVLAITQLYQHILEGCRTCREAWGCLFGHRNIIWLETVLLSWSVKKQHMDWAIWWIYKPT